MSEHDDLIEEKMDYTPIGADVRSELERHRQWWESYAHETTVEKVAGLGAACSYWHSIWETAIEERDEAWAEVARLRKAVVEIAGTVHELGLDGRLRKASRALSTTAPASSRNEAP